jgi:hypothetical protein
MRENSTMRGRDWFTEIAIIAGQTTLMLAGLGVAAAAILTMPAFLFAALFGGVR